MTISNELHNTHSVKAWMYRVPGEHIALLGSLLLVIIVSYFFSFIEWQLLILFFVGAIIYIQLSQAQYLGNAIRVHEKQFPEIYEIFKKYAIYSGISKAALYLKQDPTPQAYTLGLGTCTIVITSGLIEQMNKKELSFVIGHELGHFAAGHTKISTITNAVGSNNVFSDLLFGFWNRKCEYTSDRCGLVLTKDIDSAISALIKLSIGKNLYEKMDAKGYLSQLKATDTTSVKLSELLGSHPLITNRVKNLIIFWKENFALAQTI